MVIDYNAKLFFTFSLIFIFRYFCLLCTSEIPPSPPLRLIPMRDDMEVSIVFDLCVIPELCLLFSCLVILIRLHCPKLLHVRYITFDTNLSTLKKGTKFNHSQNTHNILWLISLGFIINNTSYEIIVAWFIHMSPNLYPLLKKILKFYRIISYTSSLLVSLYMLTATVSPASHILRLVATYISCTLITRNVPSWVPLLLILLSNDIESNPGPHYHENFFTFMNWNLNSIVKNKF